MPRVVSFGEKHAMLRIQLLFNTIALYIRIQLSSSFIRRIPLKKATRLVIFEGSNIWGTYPDLQCQMHLCYKLRQEH